MVGDVADPPAGGATPRHSRARRGIGPRPATRARPLRAASKLRPRTGRAPQGRGRRPAARRRDAASGAGPLRREGQAEAEPHQRRQSRRRASAGRLAVAWPSRAGGPHRPKSPHEWGRGGPEHRRRDRRGGGAGQGPRSGPRRGLGLAARGGAPEQRLAAGKPEGRRPEPPQAATSRHITPTAAGGRGGRRPSRPGWAGVAARRPLGAGGTRPEGADGSPHQPAGLASLALPSAAPSRAGGVWGGLGRGPGRLRPARRAAPRPRPQRGRGRARGPRTPGVRRRAATLRPEGAKRPGHQAGPSAI